MPTALSSTERTSGVARVGRIAAARRAVVDVGILFRFRAQAVRRRHLARWLSAAFVVVTLAVCVLPAFVPRTFNGRQFDVRLLMPSAMAGILVLSLSSAIASGGGRELISRDHAAPYPVSPTTDHLGALLLAPLNIAWMIQAWVLLGSMAFSNGLHGLLPGQLVMVLWLVFSTSIGQVVAWAIEAIRRGPYGLAITRGLLAAVAAAAAAVQLTHHMGDLLDRIPTVSVFLGAVSGWRSQWWIVTGTLLAATLIAIVLGAVPAHLAAGRLARDETKMETDQHRPRPLSRKVFSALVRTDRASVWRSVPMRRGLLVLAVGPGLVAIFGNLQWPSMTILPGLVASGGALLFGVNAWCLDGRGALWRENLPAPPTTLFDARTFVLAEFLAAASLLTILIAGLRAGIPAPEEFSALVCTLVVVVLQVVGASMRWSIKSPFPVDLRSARATPAPPAAMVGYSARLAISTTFTSLVFSGLAHVPVWPLSPLFAAPCVAWSGVRLWRARKRWQDPVVRARVVATTAS